MKKNAVLWILLIGCLVLVMNADEEARRMPLMRHSPGALSLVVPQDEHSLDLSLGREVKKSEMAMKSGSESNIVSKRNATCLNKKK